MEKVMQTLENREFDVQGNWYEPSRMLRQYKSVVAVYLVDTISSAGDWSGVLVQKVFSVFYVIPFSQTNNYPHSGFTLNTGDKIATCDKLLSEDELADMFIRHCELA